MADVFGRVRAERDQRQLEAIYDLFFQLRFDPVQRRYWQWETLGAAVPEPVRPADRQAALALVAAHEGPESAAIAARWLDRQPEGFTLYRTRGELGGVIGLLSLDLAAREDVQADPVTAAALRATLIDAAGVLHGHPRDERLFRAVDRTYLRPAPTQERAAELLGLPFSTYRRHLAQGVARIAARLWEREEQARN